MLLFICVILYLCETSTFYGEKINKKSLRTKCREQYLKIKGRSERLERIPKRKA
jgi:hypothetical protein